MMSAVPISIFFVLGIHRLFSVIPWGFGRWIPQDRFLSFKVHFTMAIVAMELILIPIRQAEAIFPTLLDPIFNSCWARALIKIRVTTPPESIVNSWWPPGHFIKAIAERRVTFDGATINKPQGYWMASVFLAQTERQAAGLLRMLNNSANQSAEYLQTLGWSLPEAVTLLQSITPLSRKAAQAHLSGTQLSLSQIRGLLDLTHHHPPPTYLMIYNDLVEKSIQLNFVGDWNFRKAAAMDRDPAIQKTIRRLSRSNYAKFLWDLSSSGPLRASEPLPMIAETQDGRLFQNGVYVSSQYDCRIKSATFGDGVPLSIFYMTPYGVKEREFHNATLSYSVMLIEDRGSPRCLLMDRRLANSLIMKLFYFNGNGLRYFEPLTREKDLTGRTEIAVFRVNWENFLADIDLPGPATPAANPKK